MILEKNKILQERAIQLARVKQDEEVCDKDCSNVINFILSGRSYCLDVSFAKEILTIESLIPIPGTAPTIAGIYNLRGQLLTVIHLHKILNIQLGEVEPKHVLVLCDEESGSLFGILVDQIVNTFSLGSNLIQELPANQDKDSRVLLSGVSTHGHTIINTKHLIQTIFNLHSNNNS